MRDLDAAGFVEFFQALWGKAPFAWQKALARRVLERGDAPWPEAIALPTAAGKTACMDVAVFALAAQAGRLETGTAFTAPRRVFFVVDRRVIVDEAFERARSLAMRLKLAQDGIVREVAERLRQLAGGAIPLAAHQLRGGIMRSDAWAKSPTQPMIVASTVDQFGSRLLFRAYGPGAGMRPVHAGLVGNDSLILLDEAHCAQPFLETLHAVKRYRGWAEAPLPSPFHVTAMSATPPAVSDVFGDSSDEGRDPEHPLGRRQLAGKPARLVVADKAKGKKPAVVKEEMAKELVKQALDLVKQWSAPHANGQSDLFDGAMPGRPAVVLFCNRVDTARHAHSFLERQGADASLLTGRMRPIDKDDMVDGELVELSVERSASRRLDQPRFVVATQTLEVGANLDFDLLVTECASLDALRQRFGRLNRMGRDVQAHAVIVVRADQTEKSDDDPVYGAALANTWSWLRHQAGDGVGIDFGIAALAQRLPEDTSLSALNAPSANAPVMLPAHVDALAQTAPEPWPSPDVALFLHGPNSGPADVQVCWRADLTGDECVWADAIDLCPPTSPECLSVPIGQMRRWLAGAGNDSGADVEGETAEAESANPRPSRKALCWRGRGKSEVVSDASNLWPGDVLVIPASQQGWEALATLGSDPVPDWGERAQLMARGKALLRLHPEVLKQWPASEPLDRLRGLAEICQERLNEDPGALADDLKSVLADWASSLDATGPAWLKVVAGSLSGDRKLAKGVLAHPTGGLVVCGSRRIESPDLETGSFSDEDDVASSGTVRSLLLEPMGNNPGHLDGVAEYAARHARLCGLPADLAETVEAAGRGHDLGKADPRFQAWLKGGNPWARGALLAKSGDMAHSREESRKARERARYPEGGRHELLSVRLLESAPDALPKDETLRDLLLHLVESHHGYCRPFAPVVEDGVPIQVSVDFASKTYAASSATGLERLDAGPAERYWRLTRRYGWWGLAWLEAMLRLADHRRSDWEERHAREVQHG
ncbi:MAG: type I-U CRISPR-associated helicase/endonuclease Cas3 [Betaproteobacteria bacterium]|nr:type I-U CRISPR-associated helicase/endonuclease Cas3 [Betaproteobacteria bacterium]